MEIGLFQLENLFFSRNLFLLLDLRPEGEELPTPDSLKNSFKHAQRVRPTEVEAHLQKIGHKKDQPVVLVCEDGKSSRQAAKELEQSGYTNVCVVADGVVGLLAEI